MKDEQPKDELRQRILGLNLIKDHAYTPKNVVLVTLDDVVELFNQLAPYSMQKLDEARVLAAQLEAAKAEGFAAALDTLAAIQGNFIVDPAIMSVMKNEYHKYKADLTKQQEE